MMMAGAGGVKSVVVPADNERPREQRPHARKGEPASGGERRKVNSENGRGGNERTNGVAIPDADGHLTSSFRSAPQLSANIGTDRKRSFFHQLATVDIRWR